MQHGLAFENIVQAHALADFGTTDLVPTMYRTPRYGIATNQSIRCRYFVYEMENRIKEQQLALFADRTSSSKWWTNQYRVLLAALAYTLLETMRRTALEGTKLARAQCHTLRLRLLRIGAVVTRNTRTIAVRLSSACPDQGVFRLLVQRLTAG